MTVYRWTIASVAALWLVAVPVVAAQEGQAAGAAPHSPHSETGTSIFPSREASGTSWLPDLTPMLGFHAQVGDWDVMLHGNAFVQFLYEAGETHRTSHQFGSINWLMGMAARPVGQGRLSVRAMISLEPWTISGCGYPNLLATGEVCEGDTIHDRQHPHDLFMEFAAAYDRPIGRSVRWQVYAGPAGEPALGPPGFPHRPSAFPNPIAPIAHHWLDSTHITFGLVTAGLYGLKWKVESSVFNAREPDDRRADLDLGPLDSVSARLALAPTRALSLQVSGAHLKQAEAGVGKQPRTDVERFTASAIYHRTVGDGNLWATTLAYGVNSEWAIIPGDLIHQTTHALLLESSATAGERHTWFGRLEVVGKPAGSLHADEYIRQVFTVGKLGVGYVHHLKPWNGLLPGVGASVTASVVPELLAPRYGGRIAPGFGLFVTVRARQMPM